MEKHTQQEMRKLSNIPSDKPKCFEGELPQFQQLKTFAPYPKFLVLPEILGSIELLLCYCEILLPTLIEDKGSIFREYSNLDTNRKLLRDQLKGKGIEDTEKIINRLSIHSLFQQWPEVKHGVALGYVEEIATGIKGIWEVHLQKSYPERDFCVEVIEMDDLKTEKESWGVTFYELRHHERELFDQLLKRKLGGDDLPSYYRNRLNTLFRSRYFSKIPEEKENPKAKPDKGGKAFYLSNPGVEVMNDAIAALLKSLEKMLLEEKDGSDEYMEDKEAIRVLRKALSPR